MRFVKKWHQLSTFCVLMMLDFLTPHSSPEHPPIVRYSATSFGDWRWLLMPSCPLPAASQRFPAFFRRFPSMPNVVTSFWKAHYRCVRMFTKMMVHFSLNAGIGGAMSTRKSTSCSLERRCRACVNPTISPVYRLSPSSVQVRSIVVAASCAKLVVCRGDL